jgi:hypothetical protein
MSGGQSSRETWCGALPDRSLATLRKAADGLTVEQLRPHGYDYCYLNLLTVLGAGYSTPQLSSLAAECVRSYLYSGEEFHAYCLAARGKLPWDAEFQALNTGIGFAGHAKSILCELLAKGSVIACGFHWGAFRFIPIGLSSLGYPVNSVLSAAVSDRYASYSSFSAVELAEARARGVSEAFYGVKVIDSGRQQELFTCLKALKRTPGCLFVPVDGMFTSGPSRHSVAVSFSGYPLQVKANAATLAAGMQAALVAIFAARDASGNITIDLADVIEPGRGSTFAREAMQRIYTALEKRVMACPEQWEGARTFHHLRKAPASTARANPSAADLSAVRAEIERERLSLDESRIARMQMPGGGQAWVDCRTLRCFGRTPEIQRLLTAIQRPGDLAALWEEYRKDEARGIALLQFLGQLRAEGLVTARS